MLQTQEGVGQRNTPGYGNQNGDRQLSTAGTPHITPAAHRQTPAQPGILQPYVSDTSSDRIAAWASPTLRALREKYGGSRGRDPSVSTTLQSPSGIQERTPQNPNTLSPFPLQNPSVLSNLSSGNLQSADRRQQGNSWLSSGVKRQRPFVNIRQRKLSTASKSKVDNCRTPAKIFEVENSPKRDVSENPTVFNPKRMKLKTLQIDEEEYKSLPEYMQTMSHKEMSTALRKIITAYEEGAPFLTSEDVVILSIPTSATFLHCLTTLKILTTGFSHGRVIYEPGPRMLM